MFFPNFNGQNKRTKRKGKLKHTGLQFSSRFSNVRNNKDLEFKTLTPNKCLQVQEKGLCSELFFRN